MTAVKSLALPKQQAPPVAIGQQKKALLEDY